ncbi:Peroxiredoxin [Saccharicrinis carchari]|uniref:Peroxiredoxin n=1 Tax=Saccharicrinis carchari TaxID=1168039 RepID=A0A521BYS0_SACCC|nr:TlpA disulfide reductase family protein [Saccharicrinis carchari]SMO51650.1 Peroxiredoxin [Saccharicrinis carchari]
MNILRTVLFAAILFAMGSCGNKNQLKVSGKILSAEGKTLYLQHLNLDGVTPLDSAILGKKGTFKFSVPRLKHPTFMLLKLSENNLITLLADSTEKIEVLADAKNLETSYTVSGSMGSSYVKTLNSKLQSTKNDIDSLITKYNALPQSESEDGDKLRQSLQETVNKQKDFIYDFVMNNPRSFASYYAIFQRFDDGTLILDPNNKKDLNMYATVATSLNLIYPEAERVEQLKNFVLSVKREQRSQLLSDKMLSEAKGVSSIPEIEEENLQGEKVKLSSLKGKLVLLSFWASWDAKSVQENKRLLSIYKKYNSKGFEIYQVSLDKSKLLWEDAIKKDQLPWINVSDLQYTNSYPARLYNVQQLPGNYLISREGEIIGKNLFGRVLDEKLNDLLN